MATKGQFKLANKLLEVIKKNPEGIHKFDLMDIESVKISIGTYDKIKPWFEHRFADFVTYDKQKQKWFPLQPRDIE